MAYNLEILTKDFFMCVVVSNPHDFCHQQGAGHLPVWLSPGQWEGKLHQMGLERSKGNRDLFLATLVMLEMSQLSEKASEEQSDSV